MSTIFSKILAGEAPATFVYRDAQVAAFMDIQPVNAGHVLVVPVEPASDLSELDDATAARLFVVAKAVAAAIRQSGVRCQGVNLFLADGEAAGQEVFHVHLHVIPRFAGDGFGLKLPPQYAQLTSREALEAVAGGITAALKLGR